MPVVSLMLNGSSRMVLSPIYYKIVQDIVDVIKIPNSTVVVLHRDIEHTLTNATPNTTNLNNPDTPTTVSKRRIVTTITDDYNEDELTTTAVHQLASYPIFMDKSIDVFIYPIYIKTDVNIDFSFITPSRSEAVRIRDDIRLRLSQTRNITIHEIEYTFLIPKEVEDFITDVYDLKNRLEPQTLEEYFTRHGTDRLHLVTDMSNKENVRLGVYEKQTRIVGLFDFSSMPEKVESDNENNNYKLSFTYKLSIDAPKAIAIRYPPMICNRPLPSKYLSFIEDHKRYSKEEHKRDHNYTSIHLADMSIFEAHRQLENRVDINLPINIPAFDEFNERVGHPGYSILVSYLTDVNETDKRTLFNLNDTDPFYIPEPLCSFIKNVEYQYITKPYQSMLFLGLHQDEKFFNADLLTLDSNLNIVSRVDIPLYRPTRVTLGFIHNLDMLNDTVWDRYINHPEILTYLLTEFIETSKHFKTEMLASYDLTSLYAKTLQLIYHFSNNNRKDIVTGLLGIFNSDFKRYEEFIRVMKTNEPTMFNSLLNDRLLGNLTIDRNRGIYIDRDNPGIISPVNASVINEHRDTLSKNVMRTVMLSRIIAMKLPD